MKWRINLKEDWNPWNNPDYAKSSKAWETDAYCYSEIMGLLFLVDNETYHKNPINPMPPCIPLSIISSIEPILENEEERQKNV